MSKDPAFLFYPGDWLGGTMGMSFEQKGCYLELLMMQFNHGKFTESEVKQVLSVCFDYAWPTLKRKFETDGTYFWNGRMQEEIEKRQSFIESRRLSGLTPKKYKAHAKRKHKRTEDRNKNRINIRFEDFWNVYDKKRGDKTKLEIKWRLLSDKEREDIMTYIPKYKQSTPDKAFRKDPQTFLNNHSWNDEIIIPNRITAESTITHAELLRRFNNGETDVWEKYEQAGKINGKAIWKLKTNININQSI